MKGGLPPQIIVSFYFKVSSATPLIVIISVPSEPRNVTALNITPKSLNYTWDIPRYPNGVISIYNMVFEDLGPAYFQPNKCSDVRKPYSPIQQDARTRTFTDLRPFNKYSFQVCASNAMTGEYSDVLITTTLPDGMYFSFV